MSPKEFERLLWNATKSVKHERRRRREDPREYGGILENTKIHENQKEFERIGEKPKESDIIRKNAEKYQRIRKI